MLIDFKCALNFGEAQVYCALRLPGRGKVLYLGVLRLQLR
jgi:hypothetical protein